MKTISKQGEQKLKAYVLGCYFSAWGADSTHDEAEIIFDSIQDFKQPENADNYDLNEYISEFCSDNTYLGEYYAEFGYMQIDDFAETLRIDYEGLKSLILSAENFIN